MVITYLRTLSYSLLCWLIKKGLIYNLSISVIMDCLALFLWSHVYEIVGKVSLELQISVFCLFKIMCLVH